MSRSGPRVDLIGKRFGMLTVSSFVAGSHKVSAVWICVCDCGQIRSNSTNQLNSGRSRSCGCGKHAAIGAKKRTHGHTSGDESSRTYRIWTNMKTRCGNPKASNFKYYGGRGIGYAPEWSSFSTFLRDMGPCPPGLTLERLDNKSNYSKDNCTWTTQTNQMRNTCKTVWLEIGGERISLPAAAHKYGVNPGTLWSRLNRGKSHAESVGLA